MTDHTPAINVLKDELDVISNNVKTLMMINAKANFKAALRPNLKSAHIYEGLATSNELKRQIDRGNSIIRSIKFLEGDQ
jgi:hypothetical protein